MEKRDPKVELEKLFPRSASENQLDQYVRFCLDDIASEDVSASRHSSGTIKGSRELCIEYSGIPEYIAPDPLLVTRKIVKDFFQKVPKWREPLLMYNVGAPVNTPAAAVYALANDENIFNINDGLAGNTIHAEQLVARLLADLAGIKTPVSGFFTFGGTATNYYATKIGIMKCDPKSRINGVSKDIKTITTQDAHYSHKQAADWLGLGTKNSVEIKANKDRSTDINVLKTVMTKLLKNNIKVATIIVNGGTTYNHTIDNIREVVRVRDELVKKFNLPYKPHIHVDSVIGWVWLSFDKYDFSSNPLRIDRHVLRKIKTQYNKIKQVGLADSWSADFHKGAGSAPIPCSIFILNDRNDLKHLDKKSTGVDIHPLAPEFSTLSPADFTIETSRSSGAPLAALTTLFVLGKEGLRQRVIDLVATTTEIRAELKKEQDIEVVNEDDSLGYVTMIRLLPPGINKEMIMKMRTPYKAKINEAINKYTLSFFVWDKQSRIDGGVGIEYSFSKHYQTDEYQLEVSGIKLYPTSPFVNPEIAIQAARTIILQKNKFDQEMVKKSEKIVLEAYLLTMKAIGTENFTLFGGLIADSYWDSEIKANDIDIAIEGRGKRENVVKHLEAEGFKIIVSSREYIIRESIKTTLVYAEKNDVHLDICFIDKLSDLRPPFNLENVLYSKGVYSGLNTALKGIARKNIIHVGDSLEKENPYLLLSRAMRLMSKYQFDLADINNAKIIKDIIRKITEKEPALDGRYFSCLNSMIKSILGAIDGNLYLTDLVKLGVLQTLIPGFMNAKYPLRFKEFKINNKEDLVSALQSKLDHKGSISLRKIIKELANNRQWEVL